MALNLSHQTAAQFAARFWERVLQAQKSGDKLRRDRLIWWLLERIAAGDFTDAQVRNTFNTAFNRNLTNGAWTTYKTDRLQPMHDRHAALIADGDL